jgi:hypothetical protein
MSFNIEKHHLEAVQYLHSLSPETLLPLETAALYMQMSVTTVRTYVTRCPAALPPIIRIGRRIFFRKRDIDLFIEERRIQTVEPAYAWKRGSA